MENLMEIERVQLAKEEAQSFIGLVSAQKKILYGIAYSYFRSETDALEMLQEATFRAWSRRKSLKDPQRFAPWITRILINCCNDEMKRRKRMVSVKAADVPSGEVMVMTSDRKLDMEQALDGVKLKYRQVIVLKYYRDMTLTEIAEVLDKPEGTVKTWLNKGLKQLRNKMKGGSAHGWQ
ncbi:RNA polymerase sigma factor [Paenibacillus sp. FSL R7-0273]|uniref:sigma-70 family RNA polymerase sigma factor n=1 Tax=Paenibacillus sp. FSL R7-0273 TaxID=1536772 RepID=UPI0004F5D99E|nr:sigma-70 family RNA polymerase sigma factor [Paenibacillus sp. FSL R7-0273]AIQ46755.1 RNA polymerase sigma factor [Paenibacillus sp. FSL R7-0273]OMF97473.1 RNA polymerase subunit sigma [Paenibacillus sp. FSL R7-0273]